MVPGDALAAPSLNVSHGMRRMTTPRSVLACGANGSNGRRSAGMRSRGRLRLGLRGRDDDRRLEPPDEWREVLEDCRGVHLALAGQGEKSVGPRPASAHRQELREAPAGNPIAEQRVAVERAAVTRLRERGRGPNVPGAAVVFVTDGTLVAA
jgi:hypothetical protein